MTLEGYFVFVKVLFKDLGVNLDAEVLFNLHENFRNGVFTDFLLSNSWLFRGHLP